MEAVFKRNNFNQATHRVVVNNPIFPNRYSISIPFPRFVAKIYVPCQLRVEMSHDYIPSGYSVLTPYLCCRNASRAIDFYRRALGAREEGQRWLDPNGKVGHAELSFAGQKFFVSDPYPDIGAVPPDGTHRAPQKLCLYVPNLDSCIEDCIRHGATIIQPIKEERGLGTRSARIADPSGHVWIISTKMRSRSSKDVRSVRGSYSRSGRMSS